MIARPIYSLSFVEYSGTTVYVQFYHYRTCTTVFLINTSECIKQLLPHSQHQSRIHSSP